MFISMKDIFIWPVKNYLKNVFESATFLSDDAETVFISH